MKKTIRSLAVAALTLTWLTATAVCVAACETHTHVWGEWQRSATEHWRVCTVEGCNEEQRGTHAGAPCSSCAYGFKALAFGFTEGGDAAHADFGGKPTSGSPHREKSSGLPMTLRATITAC